MSQYRRIMLIADPSMHRTAAFARAVCLARATGASLHLGLFDFNEALDRSAWQQHSHIELARTEFLCVRRAWLEQQAAELRLEGLEVSFEAVWAHRMEEEILVHAVECGADIVVKDIHVEPLLKRVLFTPLDWQLLRNCPLPLFLVNREHHAMPRRVVVAVDTMPRGPQPDNINDEIIKAGLELALQCNAECHLLHSFDALPTFVATDPTGCTFTSCELYDALLKAHDSTFQTLADAHGVPYEQRHFQIGQPAVAIADFAASHHVDVVVLGTQQHSRLDRAMMGSTAESILSRIPCSVLAIKPSARAAQLRERLVRQAGAIPAQDLGAGSNRG